MLRHDVVRKSVIIALLLFALVAEISLAHQPIIEQKNKVVSSGAQLNRAVLINDPTKYSEAVYGAISKPDEVDIYTFIPSQNATIPVEVLVPVRYSNKMFRPVCLVIGEGMSGHVDDAPIKIPSKYGTRLIKPPAERTTTFEPFSEELLYNGRQVELQVRKGKTYYILIYDEAGYMGDYTLGIGSKEDFSDITLITIVKRVVLLKLGLVGEREVPWADILAMFFLLMGSAVGLGSAIAMVSNKGNSSLLQMIKVGIVVTVFAGLILYRESGVTGVAFFQLLLVIPIIIGAILLQLRKSITAGLVLMITSWAIALFLLVWYLMFTR